jgi:large subunit ribosomal protein L25
MKEFVLKTEPRTETGTSAARRLRRDGRVPAVVYGQGEDPVHVVVDERDLSAALRHHAQVIDLELPEGVQRTLIRELQLDTYGERVRHIDLLRVVVGEVVTTEVGLTFFGTPKGVTEGDGVLETPLTEVEIECVPSDIPESIEVDVRKLEVGDRIHVADLVLPEGVRILTEPGQLVASVVEAEVEEEEEGEPGEGPAEPEVIGREDGDD